MIAALLLLSYFQSHIKGCLTIIVAIFKLADVVGGIVSFSNRAYV